MVVLVSQPELKSKGIDIVILKNPNSQMLQQSTMKETFKQPKLITKGTQMYLQGKMKVTASPEVPHAVLSKENGSTYSSNLSAIQKEDLKTMLSSTVGCSEVGQETKDKFSDFNEFKGGFVALEMTLKVKISGKGTITSCLDFEKVSYVEELKFNLLSVSQICDKKHNVLFTDKECLILSPKFKFVDEDLVILRAPRKNDVYSLDLKNIIPSGGITCLVAKATEDEAVLWHRRLGHVNFKNINKLVKGNLVRGLPSKTFKLDHSCLACRKGKQHRASCKKIEERTVREPLELLHMDLFGPVSVESVNRKKYCLVVTDDCSKFSWVFFLAYKDETYDMLHDLIVGLENKLRHKVKTIRCDHGTEFKNQLMNEFCAKKGIKREYVAAASCCAQVLWMQNQLLDYGFNFMNTEIHIDNESTICIVKNPVFHSKTKHIQIRHHFIRDCYEQRLINVVKVHTDDNVADLLTKGFDLTRFNFLVVTIGMMNP
ncbi:putative ribonuclease H-like domain-containing protein [Tanacetum coccineum]